MKKLLLLICCLGLLAPWVQAKDKPAKDTQAVVSAEKEAFKERHKQIKELIKKYKKAPESEKPAIKAELTAVVSTQVDAQMDYMKAHIAAERANLDNWEKKIQADEQNLPAVKAQRVEDLLSGEAEKKQKAAKKAWRQQMKKVK